MNYMLERDAINGKDGKATIRFSILQFQPKLKPVVFIRVLGIIEVSVNYYTMICTFLPTIFS